MVKIRNNLKNRAAAVRDGKDTLIKIPAGETREVEGFDASDTFHAGLIARRDISVGKGNKVDTTDEENGALQAALTDAENVVKMAKDNLAAAEANGDDTPEKKKAISVAKGELGKAWNAHGAAKKAFEKGV